MTNQNQEPKGKLLPCPFCGRIPKIVNRDVEPQGDPWYGTKCEDFILCECGCCLFDGAFHEGFWNIEERGVKAWNTRQQIIEALNEKAEWISVKDRLPENCEFFAWSSATKTFARWKTDAADVWFKDRLNHYSITHWRELPNPPTNGKDL